jgi:hypothetical protein
MPPGLGVQFSHKARFCPQYGRVREGEKRREGARGRERETEKQRVRENEHYPDKNYLFTLLRAS